MFKIEKNTDSFNHIHLYHILPVEIHCLTPQFAIKYIFDVILIYFIICYKKITPMHKKRQFNNSD